MLYGQAAVKESDVSDLQPFSASLSFESGDISGAAIKSRRLSEMADAYADQEAARAQIADGDPLVYEVHEIEVPRKMGQLLSSTTIIQPGRVGDEYYMTKGHFHANPAAAEIYLGLRGAGVVLLRTRDGEVAETPICAGEVAYIPPGWAHRTINTGDEELVFYAIFPGDAGYDYETIAREGFGKRILASQR